MYGYIYETTNLINTRKYIGKKASNKFLAERYLGSGKILNQAIEKYGKENFRVKLIEECSSKEQLNEKEKYWIERYNSVNSTEYYNITIGGDGGDTFSNNPNINDIKNKISKAHLGKVILNKDGKEYHVNKENLEEYLKNGYVLGRGNFIVSDTYKKAQRDRNLGKKRSKETRERMSMSFTGRKYSESTRKNMSIAAKNRKHTYWITKDNINKKVYLDDIEKYLKLRVEQR